MSVYLEKNVGSNCIINTNHLIHSDIDIKLFSHQITNLNSLSIDEVVQRVVDLKKDDYIDAYGEQEFYSHYKQVLTDKYTNLETVLRENQLSEDWDAYEPAGSIKLSIDPDYIDSFVQEKFSALRNSGLLLYRSEFEQQEEIIKFRKPGYNQSADLTRLWGAEFLRKKLSNVENYAVPRFFIIIENSAKKIPVTIVKDTMSLVIAKCDTSFAEVVVENMENTVATCTREKHGWMSAFGYVDYADSGNIREDRSRGQFYVVDTEWKSLDGVVELVDESLLDFNPSITKLRRYASERFDALHPETSVTRWTKIVEVNI